MHACDGTGERGAWWQDQDQVADRPLRGASPASQGKQAAPMLSLPPRSGGLGRRPGRGRAFDLASTRADATDGGWHHRASASNGKAGRANGIELAARGCCRHRVVGQRRACAGGGRRLHVDHAHRGWRGDDRPRPRRARVARPARRRHARCAGTCAGGGRAAPLPRHVRRARRRHRPAHRRGRRGRARRGHLALHGRPAARACGPRIDLAGFGLRASAAAPLDLELVDAAGIVWFTADHAHEGIEDEPAGHSRCAR